MGEKLNKLIETSEIRKLDKRLPFSTSSTTGASPNLCSECIGPYVALW
jgi:hypothetical protein